MSYNLKPVKKYLDTCNKKYHRFYQQTCIIEKNDHFLQIVHI